MMRRRGMLKDVLVLLILAALMGSGSAGFARSGTDRRAGAALPSEGGLEAAADSPGQGDARLIRGEVVSVDREKSTFIVRLRPWGRACFLAERSTRITKRDGKGGLIDVDFSALAPRQTVRLEVRYGRIARLDINRFHE